VTALHCMGHGETCSVVAETDREVQAALAGHRAAAGKGRCCCCSRKAVGPRSLKAAENRSYQNH